MWLCFKWWLMWPRPQEVWGYHTAPCATIPHSLLPVAELQNRPCAQSCPIAISPFMNEPENIHSAGRSNPNRNSEINSHCRKENAIVPVAVLQKVELGEPMTSAARVACCCGFATGSRGICGIWSRSSAEESTSRVRLNTRGRGAAASSAGPNVHFDAKFMASPSENPPAAASPENTPNLSYHTALRATQSPANTKNKSTIRYTHERHTFTTKQCFGIASRIFLIESGPSLCSSFRSCSDTGSTFGSFCSCFKWLSCRNSG
mmetsp:Transcript_17457/g.43477  ORF Transcript_17457/g.43477 Transcript_17457/m.43477 type:complete len:261 (+) Transcript_17457:1595-2377(+)